MKKIVAIAVVCVLCLTCVVGCAEKVEPIEKTYLLEECRVYDVGKYEGEIAIIDDKILRDKANPDQPPWFEFNQDVKSNYILGDLLDARRTTLVDFYREIGVRMLDDKKERMLTAEVDAGNAETFIRSEVWMESLKDSCEKTNAMFGTNIKPILNRPDIPGGGEEADNVSE